jgi:type I restriction enzyme S subunit
LNYLDSHQIREDNFLEEGDLLITRLSGSVEYVGCCAIAGKIPEEGMQYPDRIFCGKLALRDKEFAYYLMHCLFSPQARILIEAAAKSTAGHKRISLSDLFPFPIPLPPESELKVICNQIADSLDQVRETGKAVEISLKQSAAQRKNILKAAFSGQLVPQDPDDEPAEGLLERIRAERAATAPAARRGRQTKVTA